MWRLLSLRHWMVSMDLFNLKFFLLLLFSCWVLSYSFCNPMNCITPDFPVLYCLLEFTQTDLPWVDGAIQPSQPLSPPSPPVLSLSQHQGFFQWVDSSHQVAKLLELQRQHQSFQHSGFRFPLGLTGLIFLLYKGLSRAFSYATIWKRQFFSAQPSLWSNCHICTLLLGKKS